MLLQYSCSNYRSIKDEICFSLRKVSSEEADKRIIRLRKDEIESVSVIYGANGSGKSNFISSVAFAKFLVETSILFQPGQKINISSHKLSSKIEPSYFAFQFSVDEKRYAYGFSVLDGVIDEEYLYSFPNNRQTKVFERKGLRIMSGNKFKTLFDMSEKVLHDNRLFLSCAANYSRAKEITDAFLFFSKELVIYHVNVDEPRTNNWYEYSMSLMSQDAQVKKNFVNILRLLGTGIIDIKAERKTLSAEEINKNIPSPIRELIFSPEIINNGYSMMDAKIVYSGFETDLMTEEGTGIQKLFQMICPMLDILNKDKVLFCDELETGLHQSVVQQIIQLFYLLMPESKAQLIFSTHDTSLLNTKLFRRGQIWFTELKPDRSTDLYSLAEIKNVRKQENLERGYIEGRYGAIPILSSEIVNVLRSNPEE